MKRNIVTLIDIIKQNIENVNTLGIVAFVIISMMGCVIIVMGDHISTLEKQIAFRDELIEELVKI